MSSILDVSRYSDNLIVMHNTDFPTLSKNLMDAGIGLDSLHVTNGTYMRAAEDIVPTFLAGFRYIDERVAGDWDEYVVAVNSDVSMKKIMDAKNASVEERAAVEPQLIRALKVAQPLAQAFPSKMVVVVFYDEETPTALYDALKGYNYDLGSLHKWGYGTDPNAAKIEGAHNFPIVIGYPMPNDARPVCYDITTREDQSSFVRVVKLTEELALDGKPYFTPNVGVNLALMPPPNPPRLG